MDPIGRSYPAGDFLDGPDRRETAAIDTRSLVDRVHDYLLEQIVTGALHHGQQINVSRLAETLQVSTMPVREAVRRLEWEHVLQLKPRSNCQVRVPSRRTIREIYELREILEIHAVARGAVVPDPGRLACLERLVAEMGRLDGIEDPHLRERQAVELDHRFHAVICSLAGNRQIDRLFHRMAVHTNMALIHEMADPEPVEQFRESHAEIVAGLRRGPAAAAEALRKHFRKVRSRIESGGGA